jgi:hypothetical protein
MKKYGTGDITGVEIKPGEEESITATAVKQPEWTAADEQKLQRESEGSDGIQGGHSS